MVDSDQELIEQRGRSTHHEPGIVEAPDTIEVLTESTRAEVGSNELQWGKTKSGRVPGAHFKRIELVDGGVARNEDLVGRPPVRDDNWHGSLTRREIVLHLYRRPGERGIPVSGVYQLKRERSAPVVCERSLVSGVSLVADLPGYIGEIVCRVEKLDAPLVRALEDGIA